MITNVGLALLMFCASLALDVCSVKCTQAIQDHARWRAANWGVVWYCISCIGFFAAVEHGYWLLPFEAAGYYLGTLISIKPASDHVE